MAAKQAQPGSRVKIRYSITFEDGSSVEAKKTSRPLTFTIGAGKVFKRLEEGVVGMTVNEIRPILIKAADGYGDYDKQRVFRVAKKIFPPDITLAPGRAVEYQNRDGERVRLMVNDVDETTVTVDGNHPLAGLDLLYQVELVEVE